MQKNNKEITNETLNELVIKNGKELTDNEIIVDMTNDIINNIDNKVNIKLAYDDAQLIPGSKIELPTANDVEMEKEKANNYLLSQLANAKLEKEKAAFNKMSDDEKIKNYIYQMEYYRQTNDFFKKNGFEMSGTLKRNLKRTIDRAWKNGKFKLTPEQRQDILFELNKTSNQPVNSTKVNFSFYQ